MYHLNPVKTIKLATQEEDALAWCFCGVKIHNTWDEQYCSKECRVKDLDSSKTVYEKTPKNALTPETVFGSGGLAPMELTNDSQLLLPLGPAMLEGIRFQNRSRRTVGTNFGKDVKIIGPIVLHRTAPEPSPITISPTPTPLELDAGQALLAIQQPPIQKIPPIITRIKPSKPIIQAHLPVALRKELEWSSSDLDMGMDDSESMSTSPADIMIKPDVIPTFSTSFEVSSVIDYSNDADGESFYDCLPTSPPPHLHHPKPLRMAKRYYID
jgi:hypothetical protein